MLPPPATSHRSASDGVVMAVSASAAISGVGIDFLGPIRFPQFVAHLFPTSFFHTYVPFGLTTSLFARNANIAERLTPLPGGPSHLAGHPRASLAPGPDGA